MQLANRNAIVTGASSGVGYAAALALAEAGANVCLQGHTHLAEAEALADKIVRLGRKAIVVKADFTNAEAIDRVVATTVKELGGVDIAFSNAGTFALLPLEETTDEVWHHILDVNLTGSFRFIRRVVPELKRRGKGKIITTGSIFGAQGVPNCVAYCVTKMGIHGLTRALAIELAPYKINVNCVALGNIVTPINAPVYDFMAEKAGKPGDREAGKRFLVNYYPVGRLGQPDDVAPAVVYFASDAADFVTGQVFFIDGGYSVL